MASSERSHTIRGVPPAPAASGAADDTCIRPVLLPAVAPPPDFALAATIPAVPDPAPVHPLLTIGAYGLSVMPPHEVKAFFESASREDYKKMKHLALVGLATSEQQAAVPDDFFLHATGLFEGVSKEDQAAAPPWLLRRMGAIAARSAATMVATDERVNGRMPNVKKSIENKRRARIIIGLAVTAILLITAIVLMALGVLKNPFNS